MVSSFDSEAYAAKVNEIYQKMRAAQGLGAPTAGAPGYPLQFQAQQQQQQGAGLSPAMSAAIAKGVTKLLTPSQSVAAPQLLEAGRVGAQTLGNSSLAATEGANAAWNAGADAATNAVAQPGIGFTPYLGAAGALAGGYGIYNSIKNHDTKAGAMSGAGMGAGLAAAAPLIGLGPLGWGAMGLMALGGAGVGAGLTEALGHKGTKEYQAQRKGELAKAGLRDEFIYGGNDGSPGWKDPENWQRKAGLITDKGVLTKLGEKDAASNWGAHGILKAIGNDYFDKYNERQRYQITQAAIDNNLLKGDMGDIVSKDDDLLRSLIGGAIANEDYGAKYDAWKASMGAPSSGASQLAAALAAPARSKTLSPGISKDGKRISY